MDYDSFKNSRGFFSAVTGSITAYAGLNIPNGWLLCDGASYSTTDYADLFSVIGYRYSSTSGDSFNVPDLSGQFIRGSSDTSVLHDNSSGDNARSHTLTTAQMPSHSHSYYDAYFAEGVNGGVNNLIGQKWTDTNNEFWYRGYDISTTETGSSHAFEYNTIPPYLIMNFMIKF